MAKVKIVLSKAPDCSEECPFMTPYGECSIATNAWTTEECICCDGDQFDFNKCPYCVVISNLK